MESLDLVVIGAGWYGLGAASQYKERHPDQAIAVLDYASTIGGVWAEHRHYPGLKSNNLIGMFEYPGFPMDPETLGMEWGQHPTGQAIHEYHKAFVKNRGLSESIRCSTKVLSAEHQPDGGWILTVCPVANSDPENVQGGETKLFAKRLIVATGLASEPFMPHIAGQEEFNRPLFHSKEFLKYANTVDPLVSKRVTIFGGSKFGWDAAYAYAKAGVKVDWVIRESGHGPCWMAPPFVTPLKRWLEKLVNTRFLTWFSPCVWSEAGGYSPIRSFLHGTFIGRAITRSFWSVLGEDVIGLCGFNKHPEVAKLRPWTNPMLTGASFSILNYDTDFFEIIRDGTVKVHIADLDHLSPGKVHLADEAKTVLETDAMLCVTGWKKVPPFKFLPEGIEKEIGIPHHVEEGDLSEVDLASQTQLFQKADSEILARFPQLANPSVFNKKYVPLVEQEAFSAGPVDSSGTLSTMLLYRFIVPPSATFLRTKDLAFAGAVSNFSNCITTYLQGLWITAFFDGTLARDPSAAIADLRDDTPPKSTESNSRPTLEDIRYETVLHNRFGKWRYPADHGSSYPDFVFDAVPYLDLLLRDLGLQVRRKGSWWKDITDPYTAQDYADVGDEWRRKFGAN
ncbi:related to dimethylaniline monooxygenase [Cephalotrichum gorgonifer]|uniref:Related to dimethylaniline monooxygenase n=1 Tax=Cephalotrichum gorgonifer TaxID=2041049 RepID=A0AAE8N0P5_9PEZI|nr:related to dimethylaniline monooxygenase [Cephalotrichum gorgonifer]